MELDPATFTSELPHIGTLSPTSPREVDPCSITAYHCAGNTLRRRRGVLGTWMLSGAEQSWMWR